MYTVQVTSLRAMDQTLLRVNRVVLLLRVVVQLCGCGFLHLLAFLHEADVYKEIDHANNSGTAKACISFLFWQDVA